MAELPNGNQQTTQYTRPPGARKLQIYYDYLGMFFLVCLLVIRITQKLHNWFPWNVVEGCGATQGRGHYIGGDFDQLAGAGIGFHFRQH